VLPERQPLVAWFATKGSGTNEALRIQTLLSGLSNVDVFELPFDKGAKLSSAKKLWAEVRRTKPDLLVMEGTGIAGGAVCLLSKLLKGIPFVFSSGDAVGPYVASHAPLVGWAFALYERILCYFCSGFIGWTPYLVGRALTFGAPRAMTAAGWVIGSEQHKESRAEVRSKWGVPQNHLVVGLVGNLQWNANKQCCYGWDLVQAVRRIRREDLSVLIVGDGSGLSKLKEVAGALLGKRIFLPGPVPLDEVMSALSAMDVASLPQSMDGVGMFRYTTKFPEYAAAGLPIVTNQTPAAYDLGGDWIWRIKGAAPWDAVYLETLVAWMNGLGWEDIKTKSAAVPQSIVHFNRQDQVRRTRNFIGDLLGVSGKA
jgi:glycosyltransferase involved in cell wall biosynthesis